MISSKEVKLPVVLKGSIKDSLEANGAFNSTISGVPFTDNEALPQTGATVTYTGRCELFDLSKEEDRTKYADIRARMCMGTDIIPGWEDRVQDNGVIKIYLFYMEKAYISDKTIKKIGKK